MADTSAGDSLTEARWSYRHPAAVLALTLLTGVIAFSIVSRLGHRSIVKRDMTYGVTIKPGSDANAPELIVDPFPNEPPNWTAPPPQPPQPAQQEPIAAAPKKAADPAEIIPQKSWGEPVENLFKVDRTGHIANAAVLGKYLYGTEKQAAGEPPTFVVRAAGPSRMSMKIGRVNTWAEARIELLMDGRSRSRTEIRAAKKDDERVDKVIELAIPAGEHRVTVRNIGRDWAAVEWFKFKGNLQD
jgi:hypothetical protein